MCDAVYYYKVGGAARWYTPMEGPQPKPHTVPVGTADWRPVRRGAPGLDWMDCGLQCRPKAGTGTAVPGRRPGLDGLGLQSLAAL